MTWPSPQDYSEAVQSPRTAFQDRELQQGSPELDHLGLPRPRSGSFATVYKILCGTRNWAVRCFLHPVSDQQERYAAISTHLEKTRLPYLVQFSFLTEGIRVARQTYPILKMEWVEGEPLVSHIQRNLGNTRVLLSLAGRWVEMMKALRQSSIAHGDLQHGNVLVLNGEFKLVDYDGMFVPSLEGRSSHELGQRNYQHPMRTEFDYGTNLDNFSSWVIYISLITLSVQPQLWQQFRGGDECLLFRKEDFDNPEQSPMFRALDNLHDEKLRSAVALFRSLLDLGPQDVPSLDGQVVPSLTILPKISSGGSWISDYVKQSSKTNAESKPATLDPEPTPSWIQDFVAPVITESEQKKFENPIGPERVTLALSLCAISFILVGAYLNLIALITIAWGPLLILACSYAFLSYRFRLEPAVSARKAVNFELESIAEKIVRARAIIKSRQTDKQSVHERYSFDRNKLSKELEGLRSDEKKELDGVHAAFQLEKASIEARRRALNQQEAGELQNLSNSLGSQLASLDNKISNSVQAEAAELNATLAAQQNQYVMSYLAGYRIDDASIPGIGPSFKSRLRAVGLVTAADINNRIYHVKGFGPARWNALLAWQQHLKRWAQMKMPNALSQAESDAIRAKYTSQRNPLEVEKIRLEKQIREAGESVRAKYRALRAPVDSEESAATARSRSKLESVQNKFRERYPPLENVRRKLDEDLKRAVAEIDEKTNAERKNLFALSWEQEKVRRRLRVFSRITFTNYLRRTLVKT